MKVIKFLWHGFLFSDRLRTVQESAWPNFIQRILLKPGKVHGKKMSLNCQLISNSVIQIHSFYLVMYYAGLALIVSVLMVGEVDGQDFFLLKQLVSIFFCSITCFWVHNSEYKHLIPWHWTELVILFCSLTNKNRLMTKKSNKSHSIIFARNIYTEEQT